jgi:hypothetical protein
MWPFLLPNEVLMLRFLITPFLLLIAGCGSSPNDPGVGGVTRAEADALNVAAATLDRNQPTAGLTGPAGNAVAPAK